ncbi:MetQ/NlpA family ABC transporter substrate-binding protein [Lutispora sp.]|uniref:MetQ/NlpA family ABC transporter substrate-binding protein n=1 Tax=Lutispora sp. TaxID=2828727 RepID=UPI000EBFE435|nr:MetQ/NlpA family ABC transporter substrate-binding protein [Lutispora sp.]MEA4961807.1 MetQ/NlpA family ABC transporter substrate-binding protein [Lutispora sp.]HCJ57225.1 hypothetical protein [Clostridiaceae bacterium]
MGKIKKLLSLLLVCVLALSMSACQVKPAESPDVPSNGEIAEANKPAEKKTVKIGCVSATEPAADLMKTALEGTGVEVEVVVFDGNNLPAEALNAGDIDGLFCNSLKWMKTFNDTNKANLTMPMPYYYSYSGLYSTKWKSPEEFPNGAKIIIAQGLANIDGCLTMLEDTGLIKLSDKPSENNFYSFLDIVENARNIEIIPTELTTTMSSIDDVDAVIASAVIVRDSGKLDPSSHMAISKKENMTPQGLIVRSEDENADWVKLTMEKMQTEACYKTFNEAFGGTFILYSEIDKYFK